MMKYIRHISCEGWGWANSHSFAEEMLTRMLLQVHDELVFEIPRTIIYALQALVYDEMPAAMSLDVTLKVDTKWADNWGDME